MIKQDHRKILKHLYNPSHRTPELVDMPPMNYLMIDGSGKPNGKIFQKAAAALFPVAYTLKYMLRSSCNLDLHVMPLEVQWYIDRLAKSFRWTMMLMQPEPIDHTLVDKAVEKVRAKNNPLLLHHLHFKCLREGTCVQFMHRGPYPDMDSVMQRMVEFAFQNGCQVPTRYMHDIYLNDSRKTKPENLKTIMRLAIIQNPTDL